MSRSLPVFFSVSDRLSWGRERMPTAQGARKGRDTSRGWLEKSRMPRKAARGISTRKARAGENFTFRPRAAQNSSTGRKKYSTMG